MTNRSSLSRLLVAFDVTGLPPAKELIRRLVDTDLSGVDGLRGQIVIPVAGFCITRHAVKGADDRQLESADAGASCRHGDGKSYPPENNAVSQIHASNTAERGGLTADTSGGNLSFYGHERESQNIGVSRHQTFEMPFGGTVLSDDDSDAKVRTVNIPVFVQVCRLEIWP